eukprot:TRINITY_DN1113_c0_g2_i1.p1 TRINITY_DN1113_c0_g2~~TRINITY_DN1113_c0_g2_i1.p1  ORF type:complete len:102 (-),score=14.58 TRINITY_DN1113_c0_g2_i1:320-625(-)
MCPRHARGASENYSVVWLRKGHGGTFSTVQTRAERRFDVGRRGSSGMKEFSHLQKMMEEELSSMESTSTSKEGARSASPRKRSENLRSFHLVQATCSPFHQ